MPKRVLMVGALLVIVLFGCSGGPTDPPCNMMNCPTANCGCLSQRRGAAPAGSVTGARAAGRSAEFVVPQRHQL